MSGFCPKCGRPAEDGAVFCSSCGYKFVNPAQSEAQPQQPYIQTPLQYREPKPQKKGLFLTVLSIVFFVLAAGIVAAIFLFGPYSAIPKDINGEWDCVLKVEKILNENTSYIGKDDLGDEKDTQLKLDLNKNGEGKIAINGVTFNTTYRDGKITAKSMLDDNLQFSLDGLLKKEKEGLTFTGTWNYDITKGKDKGGVLPDPGRPYWFRRMRKAAQRKLLKKPKAVCRAQRLSGRHNLLPQKQRLRRGSASRIWKAPGRETSYWRKYPGWTKTPAYPIAIKPQCVRRSVQKAKRFLFLKTESFGWAMKVMQQTLPMPIWGRLQLAAQHLAQMWQRQSARRM